MKILNWKDTEKERDAILNLTKKTFGDVEIANSSYFDWQYRDNPEGKAIVLLAQDDSNGSIIGTNTLIPIRLIVDQQEILSSLACNVQIHPDYQKKGIFSKLLSSMPSTALKNNISSLFAIPNDNSFKSFIKTGSIEVIQLPLLGRPIKFSHYFKFPLNKILYIFDNFWKKKPFENDVELFDGNFDDFEKLAKKKSETISIIQSRKKEFLKWRYLNHPTRKYQIYVLKINNELKGYIIIKTHIINQKKIGVILDYIVDAETQTKSLQSLVDKAIEYFWINDVSIAIATCRPGLLENTILHKAGFFNIPSFLKPESLYFIIQLFDSDEKLKKLEKYDNWFFSFGDYDVF